MWYKHRFRVRYQETDGMGIVYHANYLTWFEIGRTEMIRSLGLEYRSLEERGLLLPVLEAEAKYRNPARYDNLIAVYTRIESLSSVRLEFAYEIRRISAADSETGGGIANESFSQVEIPQGELLATGFTRHAWMSKEWKPIRLNREAPEVYRFLDDHYHGKKG